MTEYTVHFTDTLSVSVVIDTDETDPEAIAEAAYEELPRGGLCAHCSGWGQSWTRDLSRQEEVFVMNGRPSVEKDGKDYVGPDDTKGEEGT